MAAIDDVWLAALSKNEDDAGSRNRFNLTINIDGADVYGHDFILGWNLPGQGSAGLRDGQAGLEEGAAPTAPFDAAALTNSSVRLGLRGDDAWAPKHALVIGRAQPDFIPGRFLALAMETDIVGWLSADSGEGRLTMPLRRVGAGGADMVVRRVLMLVYTDRGDEIDTESDIRLQVVTSGQIVLDRKVTHDLNQVRAYWEFLSVDTPFTRADVASKGSIRLGILGTDAWLPKTLFLFGLDTEEGRPNQVVTLSAIPKWELGMLSTDPSEGAASVVLPISN